MAFLILVVSLYAFQQVNSAARVLNAEAQANDVANRITLGVQEALQVGAARNDSRSEANSSALYYQRTIYIPVQLQGWQYAINLTRNYVNVTIDPPAVKVSIPTFNAGVSIPANGCPTPGATTSYMVCTVAGEATSNFGKLVMWYQYDPSAPAPGTNKISIT